MGVASFFMRPWLEAAAFLGVAWINSRRRRYRRHGTPLSAAERFTLDPFFEPALLDTIRVCRIPQIEPGLPRGLIRLLRLPASVDISSASGMAFVDAIVIAEDRKRPPMSLLFHELVHCVQYRALGTHRFLRCYLHGWASAGFDYFAIPLEAQAYELQDRFDAAPDAHFSVDAEVQAELARLKYL